MRKGNITLLLLCISVLPISLQGQSMQQALSSNRLTLDSLFAIAETESRLLQSNQTAYESAVEGVKVANSQRLPSISVSANASYTGNATLMSRGFSTSGTADVIVPGLGPQPVSLGKQTTPHWGNNFAVEVNQVLFSGGAISAGIRMAELGEQMAILDKQKNRQEIRFLLTGYYLELQKLANQIEVINQNIVLTNHLISDTGKRVEHGIVLQNELTRFELQLQQLTLSRQQVEDAMSIIRYQITQTLHLPDDTQFATLDAAILAEHAQLNSHGEWLTKAMQNHVGLQQTSIASQLAEQQLKKINAASLPQVGVQFADILGGPYTQDLIPTNANTNVWYIGIGVKYNLSSLYHNNHAKRKAELDVQKAKEDIAIAQEGISKGVQAAYIAYKTSFTEVQTQQKSVQLANENYTLIEHRYSNQLCILTDVIDASSAKLSAEMALVNARISLLYNYYKLKYITNTL